jgi:hypothetical protein
MTISPLPWLLLIISLPGNSATARMRIWRALKALGCAALRDGAYLLPNQPQLRQQLRDLADETVREGGSTWLLAVQADSPDEADAYLPLFSRAADFAALVATLGSIRAGLASLTPQEINRSIRKQRREYEAIVGVDYFPTDSSTSAEAAWLDFLHVAETLLARGEPHSVDAPIERRSPAAFRGRTWATRQSLWVDRVASAWLIRRFIDPQARFVWLASPADCPEDALGFDFDGATFTHIGERVTFEVLVASFGLDPDRGLVRLGAMVHALDVGGAFVPEASGFEAMMAGARQRCVDDDQLLDQMSIVLDSLHAHFGGDLTSSGEPT